MPIRTIASFAVAIFLGLIAVLLVRGYLNGNSKAAAPSMAQGVPVVVAAAPIPRGAPILPAMLKTVSYPSDGVPTDAYHTPTQLQGDHVAMRSIAVNEPILPDRVSGAGSKAGMSGTLTPGMRAVSVRSNDVTGVAGFALPGDHVDVLLTRTIGSGDSAVTVTQVLAENVRVLGVDQADEVAADKPVVSKAVTVEVTPDQAQSIQLAQSVGTVALSLRQMADNAALAHRAMTSNDLGNFGSHPAVNAAAPLAGGASSKKHFATRGMTEIKVTRGVEMTGYSVVSF